MTAMSVMSNRFMKMEQHKNTTRKGIILHHHSKKKTVITIQKNIYLQNIHKFISTLGEVEIKDEAKCISNSHTHLTSLT